MDKNEALKERIRRLHLFSELDTPESWKVYYLSHEIYLIIRSLFPGRFSLLWFIVWGIRYRTSYHYDGFKMFLHRLGWCIERDNKGRCVICDPFYVCECEDCEELEALIKDYYQ